MTAKGLGVLFESMKLGSLTLQNRLIMASLTRIRCDPKTGIPNGLLEDYYSQRASAGLILTECSPVSNKGNCFLGAGGIYNDDQTEGWKRVTDAVHAKGGKIFLQIWHAGRAAHSHFTNEESIGPSPIAIRGKIFGTPFEYEEPREMDKNDFKLVFKEFENGAKNAKRAGFDGVELHGANGYLIDQFIRDGSNHRNDEYGGTIEKRCKFCLEVLDKLTSVFGPDRVGIKLSPVGRYQDMYDSDPVATYSYLLKEIEKKQLAYIQLMEPDEAFADKDSPHPAGKTQLESVCKTLRKSYKGKLIINNNLTPETAAQAIEEGVADAAAFGRYFVSNPDFVERVKNGWPFNRWSSKTYYQGGSMGYTDYPFYQS